MTTETIETISASHKAAIEFVNSHSVPDIITHLKEQYDLFQNMKNSHQIVRDRLQGVVSTVTDFVKENYAEGANSDDIKELAEELDIELTKNLSITFTVRYECGVTVPLDFDEDEIDDSMFDIRVEANFHDADIEVDSENTEVDDFDVSE